MNKRADKKNPAAVALGRLGGLKGGKARAEKLSAQELSEQGRNAINARWAKHRAEKARQADQSATTSEQDTIIYLPEDEP